MRAFLIGFAYFLIYTTPIAIGWLFWVFWVIFSTDHSILSLSTDIFLQENLSILRDLIFTYLWFLKPIYVFFWSFPAAILGTIKFIVNTWLGFWLLPVAKNMK